MTRSAGIEAMSYFFHTSSSAISFDAAICKLVVVNAVVNALNCMIVGVDGATVQEINGSPVSGILLSQVILDHLTFSSLHRTTNLQFV